MKYDQLEPNQKKVFDDVKAHLSSYPWFRGVCMDNFPSEKECSQNHTNAVEGVVFETRMWDDPKFLSRSV